MRRRLPAEIFYAGAILALFSIPGVFFGAARAFRTGRAGEVEIWVALGCFLVWALVGGLGLLRLQRWAALLLSIPTAVLGVTMMIRAGLPVGTMFLLPLAVTVMGWRTLR